MCWWTASAAAAGELAAGGGGPTCWAWRGLQLLVDLLLCDVLVTGWWVWLRWRRGGARLDLSEVDRRSCMCFYLWVVPLALGDGRGISESMRIFTCFAP